MSMAAAITSTCDWLPLHVPHAEEPRARARARPRAHTQIQKKISAMLSADFALLNAHSTPEAHSRDHSRNTRSSQERTEALPAEKHEGVPLDFLPNNAVSTLPIGSEEELYISAAAPGAADDAHMAAAVKLQKCVRGHRERKHRRRKAPTVPTALHSTDTQKVVTANAAAGRDEAAAAAPAAGLSTTRAVDAANDETLVALCETWLPPNVRLVAWDFDQTILSIHAFKECVEPSDVPQRWHADVCDLALLRTFVHVARSRGVHVGIASFGRQDVIIAYMVAILKGTGHEDAFNAANVATPASLGMRDGRTVRPNGKPRLLKLLRARAAKAAGSRVARSEVLFFDDQLANVETCKSNGYSRSCHVASGFTRQAIATVRSQAVAAKPPPSFRLVARLAATLRLPAASVADARRLSSPRPKVKLPGAALSLAAIPVNVEGGTA